MPFKDILVHMDNGAACVARLETAIGLALDHDAHLTGIYVITPIEIPAYVEIHVPEDVLRQQVRTHEEAAARAEKQFREGAENAGVSLEWRLVHGRMVESLSLHARYADVAVVGQRSPAEDGPDMPDRFLLSVGRPVLVIPHSGTYPKIGERIMVAWDSSRLASRAVGDAMALLESAKKVDVMSIDPHGGHEGHDDVPGADICLHLARHGVPAKAQHAFSGDIDPADMLLSKVAEEAADLLVMGAYGHARWREIVLGGFTRHVLEHMSVPTLLSH
ncbi:MAG TPA: universal stress protein [Rhodospirillales bacterium]|nr:universal stress protein [Rhodospirillales bacterium]